MKEFKNIMFVNSDRIDRTQTVSNIFTLHR